MHKSVENALLCTYFIFNGITNVSVNYVNWKEASISEVCMLDMSSLQTCTALVSVLIIFNFACVGYHFKSRNF